MTIQDLAASLNLEIIGQPYTGGATMTVTLRDPRHRQRCFLIPYPLTDKSIDILTKALAAGW